MFFLSELSLIAEVYYKRFEMFEVIGIVAIVEKIEKTLASSPASSLMLLREQVALYEQMATHFSTAEVLASKEESKKVCPICLRVFAW